VKIFCILSDERAVKLKSPDIFNFAIKKINFNGVYVPFIASQKDINEAIRGFRTLQNIAGINITIPYKESVIPYLDNLSEGANIIGSVNTIVKEGKFLKGYNTNAIAFMDALEEFNIDITGKKFLIFGTGGMARAVIFILKWLKAGEILITGRNQTKLEQVTNRVGGKAINLNKLISSDFVPDIIINATSVSFEEQLNFKELFEIANQVKFSNCKLLFDVNYKHDKNSSNFWQKIALRNNIKFSDGITMLTYQASHTFALWTGIKIEPKIFLEGF